MGRGGALGYKVMILTLMHGIEIETGGFTISGKLRIRKGGKKYTSPARHVA